MISKILKKSDEAIVIIEIITYCNSSYETVMIFT